MALATAIGPAFRLNATITFASVAANTAADQTVTVAGLRSDWQLSLILPNLQAGLMHCNAHCSAKDTLKVRFHNTTGGALVPTGTDARLIAL